MGLCATDNVTHRRPLVILTHPRVFAAAELYDAAVVVLGGVVVDGAFVKSTRLPVPPLAVGFQLEDVVLDWLPGSRIFRIENQITKVNFAARLHRPKQWPPRHGDGGRAPPRPVDYTNQ